MLADSVGKLFFIGIPGPEMDQGTRELLSAVQPGGICLFARNIRTAEQTRGLTDELRNILGSDLLISVDQEGGRVDRLRRILEPMPSVEQLRDMSFVRRHAELTARALLNLGINMNFAPVVDVPGTDRDCSGNGLATRLYGTNANDVIEFASEYITTASQLGIRTCIKHFPGLAKSRVDSHAELPIVEVGESEFSEVDLAPYRRLKLDPAKTGVMVAHAAYPELHAQAVGDDSKYLPSSLGGVFIEETLRKAIGFEGAVVTDDLEMGAILKNYGIAQACEMALRAGNDQLLICNEPDNITAGFHATIKAFESGLFDDARLSASLQRIQRLRANMDSPTDFDTGLFEVLSAEIRDLKNELSG